MPETMSLIGTYTDTKTKYELSTIGAYVYILHKENGLQVMHLVDPADVYDYYFIDTYVPTGLLLDLIIDGSYAYLATCVYDSPVEDKWNGYIEVLDMSTPASPSLEVAFYLGADHYPEGIHKKGDYLFIADMYGFTILDVSDPTNPSLEGYTTLADWVYDVAPPPPYI